jgi:hypothetical protein
MIFTCRVSPQFNPGYSARTLLEHVKGWLDRHELEYDAVYQGQGKPLATAYIDDRAINCQPMLSRVHYYSALHLVDQLARKTEAATDGDYIEELAKLGVSPAGESL